MSNMLICSLAGSTKKKKLVKKILSPIFKSSSVDGDVGIMRRVSPVGGIPSSPELIHTSNSQLPQRLVDIDPMSFAQEITLIDKELLIRIPWQELSTCGWMTKDKVKTHTLSLSLSLAFLYSLFLIFVSRLLNSLHSQVPQYSRDLALSPCST